jgi:hypothetical protein
MKVRSRNPAATTEHAKARTTEIRRAKLAAAMRAMYATTEVRRFETARSSCGTAYRARALLKDGWPAVELRAG